MGCMGTYAKNISRLAIYWWQFWPSLIVEIFFHSQSLNLEGPQLSNQENIQVFLQVRIGVSKGSQSGHEMKWPNAVGFERLISGSVGMCIFLFLDHRAARAQNKVFTNMKQLRESTCRRAPESLSLKGKPVGSGSSDGHISSLSDQDLIDVWQKAWNVLKCSKKWWNE